MTASTRTLVAASRLFGLAVVVLTVRVIGGPIVSDSPDDSSKATVTAAPSGVAQGPSDASATGISKPPLVLVPDRFGATCGSGINLPGQPRWPTRAGRGTPQTSCAFAANVLKAYKKDHPSTDDTARMLTATSVIVCADFREQREGPPVMLICAVDETNKWVTCSDGSGTRVLLF
jgi:serine/threonine protein kinase, bacterial